MKTALKYGFLLLCCLLSSRARAQTSCTRPLAQVGPVSAVNGFPLYYVDANQLALAPCLDTVGLCPAFDLPFPTAPVAFPGNFPAVFFYSLARAVITLPNGGGGRLVLAVEGSFPGGVMTPGSQFAFSRPRIRVDGLVHTFETCDDGNRLDGDCCSSTCQRDPAGTACTLGSVCSNAACDAAGVCRLTSFNTQPCDDGNACTVTDTCALGACAGTPRS